MHQPNAPLRFMNGGYAILGQGFGGFGICTFDISNNDRHGGSYS
jgi:hypothetical protein